MMVIFEDKTFGTKLVKKTKKSSSPESIDPQIVSIEQELQSTKEYLQTTTEELETSNEELRSTNEELQSTNEELQSTNEELETSKEELQSTNEELNTVNTELQDKVDELSRTNDDLNNLLASTEIGTIFLDTNLCIKRFTPTIANIFNLIQADIGRPISDITTKIIYGNLYNDAKSVLNTLKQKEVEIQSEDGKWYSMRILPYRTVENVIDGIVITFVDITYFKHIGGEFQKSEERFYSFVNSSPLGILTFDKQLKITLWNPAMGKMSGFKTENVIGRNVIHAAPFFENIEESKAIRAVVRGKATICSRISYNVPETKRNGWAQISSFPLYNENKKIIGGMAIVCNINDHEKRCKKIKKTTD